MLIFEETNNYIGLRPAGAVMDDQPPPQAQDTGSEEHNQPPVWLRASIDDAQKLEIEAPIAGVPSAEANELGDCFQAAARSREGEVQEDAASRVFSMLAAVAGMHFQPSLQNEPFGPMFVLTDGRRSPIPEDFRGRPEEVLTYLAEHARAPALRARLNDVSWLLDRKKGKLGFAAISSYLEVIRGIEAGTLNLRFEKEPGTLHFEVRDLLRRALHIARGVGWDKPESLQAREQLVELRKRANDERAESAAHWFSELDLDFGVSDPNDVGEGIAGLLTSERQNLDTHSAVALWRLAARAYHAAKQGDEMYRCQSKAAECLASDAEAMFARQGSAMLAAHSLSAAIAELHGVPGKKDRRTQLRHRLIDMQAQIPEELSTFSQPMDLKEIIEAVERGIRDLDLIDMLLSFAGLAQSPDPADLVRDATDSIQQYPLSSLFGTSHHDREGKVIHRTDGGGFADGENDSAIYNQIAMAESIRRKLVAFGQIDAARRAINEHHYLSEDVFAALLQYSPFVPHDLLATFARGFARYFRGDFVSALYILTPLLENSLRHVLKSHGHDVTIFDDASQTQQDRTISSLFEQMRGELNAIFSEAITSDIENVFLRKPGPNLRHAVAHGLLHDGEPYGSDALYACWLIMRLCVVPLFRHREQLKANFVIH